MRKTVSSVIAGPPGRSRRPNAPSYMTPFSVAARATTPGTSPASTARLSAASIRARDVMKPPCGRNQIDDSRHRPVCRDCFVAPLLAMTENPGVIASAAKQSRRLQNRHQLAFGTLAPPRGGVFGQLRGDVGGGEVERGPDVDDRGGARGGRPPPGP